jgi:hypothetical protein
LQKRARTDTEIQAEVPTAVNAAESLQEHQTPDVGDLRRSTFHPSNSFAYTEI